jgi:hypothetical protein
MLNDQELIAVAQKVAAIIKQPQYEIKPLAPKQKRVTKQLKIKPKIYDLAKEIYQINYPFAEEVDFNSLIEQLITLSAYQLGLVKVGKEENLTPVNTVKEVEQLATDTEGDIVDKHLSLLD